MAAREAELLPVAYFHVVFTLPSAIGDIAYQNKAVIYDILFTASAETLLTIAADRKHQAMHRQYDPANSRTARLPDRPAERTHLRRLRSNIHKRNPLQAERSVSVRPRRLTLPCSHNVIFDMRLSGDQL
jgi:hypothetical protein